MSVMLENFTDMTDEQLESRLSFVRNILDERKNAKEKERVIAIMLSVKKGDFFINAKEAKVFRVLNVSSKGVKIISWQIHKDGDIWIKGVRDHFAEKTPEYFERMLRPKSEYGEGYTPISEAKAKAFMKKSLDQALKHFDL
jgi:2,4-dienoyl-CoA reductase-like NADH-dependent reductase (Old Yellow Enzyme family)